MYGMKKTAIIGLGGTGLNAVLYMKKRLMDTYGRIPPMVRFLVLDTTDKDKIEIPEGTIGLDTGEFLKIEVKDTESLIESNRQVKEWLPDNVPRFALDNGAKQVRPLGRLAVFANSTNIDNKINALIDGIKDYSVDREEEGEIAEKVIVNIVASIAGGTGAGTFIDIASIVRHRLGFNNDKIIGYFLLPDAFVGKPATDNVEPNAYAALKEISWFFTPEGNISYELGGETRSIKGNLFNAIYLINNVNMNGLKYNDLNDLYEFIGTGMYLQSSVAGKRAADIIDNVEGKAVGVKWFGKPTVFSSFGLSELVYPGEWFAELYTYGIASNIIKDAFNGRIDSNNLKQIDEFIEIARLNEHDSDEVINDILKPGDFRKFPLPPRYSKEIISSTLGRREAYLNEVQNAIVDSARINLAKLIEEKHTLLQKKISSILSEPKGIETTREFANDLIGRLVEFKGEMIEEKGKFQKSKDDLIGNYSRTRSDAGNAAKAIFNSKSKIESALKDFKQLIEKEASINLEIERRERAIELFSVIKDDLTAIVNRLNAFSGYCDQLVREFSQSIQHLKLEKDKIRPFVYELIPQGITQDIPSVNPKEFLDWLIKNQIEPIVFITKKKDEIKDLVMRFGKESKIVKDIENKSLEDILKEMTEKERMRYIKELDRMAVPLWWYNRGYVSGDKKTTNLYIFGVENPNNSVFNATNLAPFIASPQPPDIIGTGDKKHMICLKVETAVPAFTLKNMELYKSKYENPDAPFYYHIHKGWDTLIPDLFPEASEEEARKYWSIGLASPFNIISKTGEYYYVSSEKYGEGIGSHRKYKLAQGRRESMKAFLDSKEILEEVMSQIDKIIKSIGNQKVKEELVKYGTDLEKKAANSTKETRSQIDCELKDIEKFINNIGDII